MKQYTFSSSTLSKDLIIWKYLSDWNQNKKWEILLSHTLDHFQDEKINLIEEQEGDDVKLKKILPSKSCNVFLNPFQSESLIFQPYILVCF